MEAALIALTAVSLASSTVENHDEGASLSYGAELTAASHYHWRGLEVSHGPVLQPAAWVGVAGFSLSAWSNINLLPDDHPGLNELDLVLGFEQHWRSFHFTPGAVLYIFPGSEAAPTAEITLDLNWLPKHLGLYSNHAYDFLDNRSGYWTENGLLAEADLGEHLAAESKLGVAFGNQTYHGYYFGAEQGGAAYLAADLVLSWTHRSGVSVGACGLLDLMLNEELRRAAELEPVGAMASITLGYEGAKALGGEH